MIRCEHSERLLALHLPDAKISDIQVGVVVELDGERYHAVANEPTAATWELIQRIRNAKKENEIQQTNAAS